MNIVVFIERGKLFYMEFVKKHPTKKEECIDLFHTYLDNIEAGSDLESELELSLLIRGNEEFSLQNYII
jgi:hypothetical protein